ncbi:MAG: GWxTD domain-containing protein [Salinibacter sp.]|uniref:GWxTD domain-containing protein n=1 Tax=Salinibacter sp. TaxID=2065818 RepID=UPI0035D4342D
METYKQDQPKRALDLLRRVFRRAPARVSERHGAAAFWLGKAYKACNRPDSMRWAWRKGVNALRDADRFDARLVDAHLWASWSRGDNEGRERATEAYVRLLSHVGDSVRASGRSVLRRHVAQMLPLLSDRQRARLFVAGADGGPETWVFRDDSGNWLAAWWRRRDPSLSTSVNERVEEHLARVQAARSKFGHEDRIVGWDERGDLYIRYGPPSHRDSVLFTDARFFKEVIRFGVGVTRSDFPANKIWSYPGVGKNGYYLFVEQNGSYKLGRPLDLVPRKLKGNFHSADRSLNRAYSSLAAMRHIFQQLSLHYEDAGGVYDDLANYFVNQQLLADLKPSSGGSVGEGTGERTVRKGPGRNQRAPSAVARRVVQKVHHQQRVFVREREKSMPLQHSDVATSETPLPVQARTARFMDEDGTTRTEVFWGGTGGLAGAETGRQVMRVSLVRYGSSYRPQALKNSVLGLNWAEEGRRAQVAPEVLQVQGTTDPYHLALQWSRFQVSGEDTETRLEDRTGRQTIRIDSLRPLSADPEQLEMSDLRPMVPSGRQFETPNPAENAIPYPFSSLTTDAPLLLYFEVYHLAYTGQDRTKYKVAYEVERTTQDGGFLGLFDGTDVERTETASTYTGTQRTAPEVILLDWNEASEALQSVAITVRVTDQTTGQTVERRINFRVAPPAGT